jgi:hypothetical protein
VNRGLFSIALLLCLLVDNSFASSDEVKLSVSGYYKNLFYSSESLSGDNFYADLNRLRLDTKISFPDKASLRLVLDNEAIFGTVLDTPEFELFKRTRLTFYDMDVTIVDNPDLWAGISVYRFYLDIKCEKTQLTVGRQRVAWGSGRLWNPTDVFNPVSPFEIERDEKAGIDGGRLDYYINPLSSITLVFWQERDARENAVLRVRTNFRGYDLSLLLGSLSNRNLVGFDFAGNLGNASLRGEATYEELINDDTFKNREKEFIRAVLSLDYTFTNTLYVLIEYFYNGGNVKEISFQEIIQSEIITRNKNFLALGLGYDLTPLLRADGIAILDIDGGGVFFNPSIKYNVRENTDLVLGTQLFGGDGEYEGFPDIFYASIKIYF